MELTVGALYKQQPNTVALSTTEIEYIMVAGQAIREVCGVTKIVEIHLKGTYSDTHKQPRKPGTNQESCSS